LETVLDYKNQILDGLKAEHAIALAAVRQKQDEIARLNIELDDLRAEFDQAKRKVTTIEQYRLHIMCIERMTRQIEQKEKELLVLQQQEEEKKAAVVNAKVDTSKFEKLRERRLGEYHKAEAKAEEAFAEEFVTHTLVAAGHKAEAIPSEW